MTDSAASESDDAAWIALQRIAVAQYLADEQVHGIQMPNAPEWYEPPVLAVWLVPRRGALALWAISGDVPTDYIEQGSLRDARAAVEAFGLRWTEAADRMHRGEEPDQIRIGTRAQWQQLGPLLRSRAQTLDKWANDPELWT